MCCSTSSSYSRHHEVECRCLPMCFSSRMLKVASYLWFRFILRSSALISSEAWRPEWILITNPTVLFIEFLGTFGWLRFSASRFLLCILFWDPSFCMGHRITQFSKSTHTLSYNALCHPYEQIMADLQSGTLSKTVLVVWFGHPPHAQLFSSVEIAV